MTDDEKNPADRAIELFLFAPLGFALSARELLPELVERGRQQVTGQVTMAKMIGQFAVQQGSAEAGKAFIRARAQAQTALEQLGVLDQEQPAATAPPAPAPPARAAAAPSVDRAPTPVPVRDERSAPAARARTTSASELAIPDYDSLSASQVLPRLSALSPEELEAVRAHETSHRGRKTILSKVVQLQAS